MVRPSPPPLNHQHCAPHHFFHAGLHPQPGRRPHGEMVDRLAFERNSVQPAPCARAQNQHSPVWLVYRCAALNNNAPVTAQIAEQQHTCLTPSATNGPCPSALRKNNPSCSGVATPHTLDRPSLEEFNRRRVARLPTVFRFGSQDRPNAHEQPHLTTTLAGKLASTQQHSDAEATRGSLGVRLWTFMAVSLKTRADGTLEAPSKNDCATGAAERHTSTASEGHPERNPVQPTMRNDGPDPDIGSQAPSMKARPAEGQTNCARDSRKLSLQRLVLCMTATVAHKRTDNTP